jgi:hypothetical protein
MDALHGLAMDLGMLECRQDLSDSHALFEPWVEKRRE